MIRNPSWTLAGNTIIEIEGGSKQTHRYQSNADAARALAEKQAEVAAENEARKQQYLRDVAAGVDVVHPHPDDAAAWGIESEPVPWPEPATTEPAAPERDFDPSVPGPLSPLPDSAYPDDAVPFTPTEIMVTGATVERLREIAAESAPTTIINGRTAASILVEAATPLSPLAGGDVDDETDSDLDAGVYTEAPETPEPPVEPAQASAPVTVTDVAFNPATSRLVANLTALEQVTLWRTMGDGSTATFDLEPGGPYKRNWKSKTPESDVFELRVGDETGPIVYQVAIAEAPTA